jgi:Clostridial hydrophobic W
VVKPELEFDRDSSLLVAPGLYVLRYESGGGKGDSPTAVVLPARESEGDIEIISAPGCAPGCLEKPGSALFIRAADHSRLQIGVRRQGSNGSLDAAFKLESVGSLSAGSTHTKGGRPLPAEDETAASPVVAAADSRASSNALFLAHVSRRGDIWVLPGQWAAGPDAPGRIEGLELRPLEKAGVFSELQVLASSSDAGWSDWIGTGAFAGSRGQNRALTGLRLRLTGDQAHRFIVDAEAFFLGSSILKKRGREVEFVSSFGRDPLVGFRFEVCPERRLSVRSPTSLSGRDSPHDREAQPRVRVFRAAEAR